MKSGVGTPLRAAAVQRTSNTLARADAALQRLEASGGRITFVSVAAEANVSRAFLYGDPSLRDRIMSLRTPVAAGAVPEAERCGEESLRERLTLAQDENRALRAELIEVRTRYSELLARLRDQR